MNIYSNFIGNKVKRFRPRDAPWIAQAIKNFLRKKNHAFKSFVRNGRPVDKLEGMQNMISRGARLIEEAKQNYFLKAGKTYLTEKAQMFNDHLIIDQVSVQVTQQSTNYSR